MYTYLWVKRRSSPLSSRSYDVGDSCVAGRERYVAGVHIAHEDIDNWERAE